MRDKIIEIISTDIFKKELTNVNVNYSNLKQELHIRNLILENLNKYFLEDQMPYKAFAEHPREKGNRVDLSIVNGKDKEQYLIEFKFQYTGDYNNLSSCKSFVDRDFLRSVGSRCTDLFVLIIVTWNKEAKRKYDANWGINSDLSKYLSLNNNWEANISQLFSGYPNTILKKFDITVNEPYETDYHFHFLDREKNFS